MVDRRVSARRYILAGDCMEGEPLLVGIIPVGNVAPLPMRKVMRGIQDALKTAAIHQDMTSHIQCGLIVDPPLNLPATAYDEKRGSYLTDPFFNLARDVKDTTDKHLRREGKSIFKALVITNVPLHSNSFNISVYGEADINGSLAVVSTAQLTKGARTALLTERTVKECAHELGHTMGLRHCENKKCVMSLSSDLYDVDSKTKFFCDSCAQSLTF